MKKIAIAMLFAGSTLLMADGAALFAKCAGCHGQNQHGMGALMKGQVASMSDADIQAVADHIAAMK